MDSNKDEKKSQWRYSLTPSEATLLLLFVVLFVPAFASLRGPESRIAYDINSLMWRVIFYNDGTIALRLELYALGSLPYIFLKYLLVFQMYRYYRHLTTKKRVLILGILSEIQTVIMLDIIEVILLILTNAYWTWSAYSWIIPIPIALVVCLLLLLLVPQPGSEPMWVEEQEEKSWWDES
ncbi:MAG: hypothetical protein ACFFE6_01580 [Candidatus Thorarchaeota archaeon]